MKREPVVLFSSCDGNYIKFIPTLLMSASEYMSAYPLEFYLLHSSIVQEELEKVDRFCRKINISFHAVQIAGENLEQYRKLKLLTSTESSFPVEGFFDILPNLHLPPHVDRALYLDAGDVILAGDISSFYFSDFNGNILTVAKGFSESWDYTADDLYERQKYLQLAAEYFNSGVVLFNIALMRRLNIDFSYYISLVTLVKKIHDGYNWAFGGGKRYVVQDDQGLLGVAFPGYINFFDPDNSGNANTPYNFRPFVIESNKQNIPNCAELSLENLRPKIIHLLGNKPGTAPAKRKNLLKISRQSLALWDRFEAKAQKMMEKLK